MFLSVLIFSVLAAQANATIIYFNDFQSGSVGSEWSSSVIGAIPVDAVPKPNSVYSGGFLGQFGGNNSATLTLTGLSAGLVTLSFDTYFIRSWDGNDTTYGPDYFKVNVDNSLTLLNNTFSNGNPAGQSYVGNGIKAPEYQKSTNTSMTGSLQQYSLGYYFYDGTNGNTNQAMDSLYHFDFSFYNTLSSLQITFAGIGLQDNYVTGPDGNYLIASDGKPYLDESWGIDNVQVDVMPVPEPASFLLLLAGSFVMLMLYRRKLYKNN